LSAALTSAGVGAGVGVAVAVMPVVGVDPAVLLAVGVAPTVAVFVGVAEAAGGVTVLVAVGVGVAVLVGDTGVADPSIRIGSLRATTTGRLEKFGSGLYSRSSYHPAESPSGSASKSWPAAVPVVGHQERISPG